MWQAMQNFGKAKLGDGPLADGQGDCWEGAGSECLLYLHILALCSVAEVVILLSCNEVRIFVERLCVGVAGLDHILDADTSSGEADTENSTDESDSDEISITDITCDFGEGLKLEHAFTMCTHVPRLRVYSASDFPPLSMPLELLT